jgi:hypothetical protein
MQTALELINLDLELLRLRLQVLELGLQRQQMHLDRPWGLRPFGLRKWKGPGWVFGLGGVEHHSYPWMLLWIQPGHHLQATQRLQSREK